MSEDKPNILIDYAEQFNSVMNLIEKNSEEYWNSLSKAHQLAAFCAVSRRIYQAEIADKGTYRHALYGVFGFGPEAYAPAQLAGYLDIHNAIMAPDHDVRLLEAFCEKHGMDKKLASEFLV